MNTKVLNTQTYYFFFMAMQFAFVFTEAIPFQDHKKVSYVFYYLFLWPQCFTIILSHLKFISLYEMKSLCKLFSIWLALIPVLFIGKYFCFCQCRSMSSSWTRQLGSISGFSILFYLVFPVLWLQDMFFSFSTSNIALFVSKFSLKKQQCDVQENLYTLFAYI